MKNPQIAIMKVEQLEGKFKQMRVGATRGSLQDFYAMLDNAEETLAELKSLINREVRSY
jgi:hypothetical protein